MTQRNFNCDGLFSFLFQMIVFRSIKSRMTDFLSSLKSKFNDQFPPLGGCFRTATAVFTRTAFTICLNIHPNTEGR